MKEEKIFLSDKEVRRAIVINKVIQGVCTVAEAAEVLSLSERQVKRLKAGVLKEGFGFLAHGNRGRKPAHAISDRLREEVLAIIRQPVFCEANDYHLTELLAEHYNISLSISSVRRIRRGAGIPSPRKHRKPKAHRRRKRREQEGMLIQMDASPHAWLGEDKHYITLVGAIDDATGKIVGAIFRPTEDLNGYFEVLRQIITNHGVPIAVYTDRHSIFVSTNADRLTIEDQLEGKKANLTQFGRALNELGIELIKARSPQAKGRVERLWETLQDRLRIELALAGVQTIEQANEFLRKFILKYNALFEVAPLNPESAFRPSPSEKELREILCSKEKRTLKGGVLSFQGQTYKLDGLPVNLPDTTVLVHIHPDGKLRASYPNPKKVYDLVAVPKPVRTKPQPKEKAGPSPSLRRPAPDHPWRKGFRTPNTGSNYTPGRTKTEVLV